MLAELAVVLSVATSNGEKISGALPSRRCNEKEQQRCETLCQNQSEAFGEDLEVKRCEVTGYLSISGMFREAWLECDCGSKPRPQDVVK